MKRFAALLLLAVAAPAAAQETQDTFLLGEVVVTASRLPQKVGSVPAAVTIIRNDEFTRLGMRNVADVLRTVSGAAIVQPGSYGALSSLFMRGGESDYVQVLLDGVQINSPGELFDFSALSLENIARVEIVKGPVSVLYGSDAVTGVIQLFSKEGAERTRSQITLLAGRGERVGAGAEGDFGTTDVRADVSGGSSTLNYALGVSHFDTEGALAYNNRHRLSSGTVRLGAAVGNRTNVALSGRITRNLFHYPTDGSGNLTDGNQFHEADGFAVGVDAAHVLNLRTELRAQLSWSRNQDHIDDAPDSPADTLGFYAFYSDEDFRRRSLDLRVNRTLRAGSVLTIGGELEDQERRGSSLSASSFGDFESAADNQRDNRAGYVQLVSALGNVSFTGGLRLDHNQPFGDFFTYRAGISWPITSDARARASVGSGFKEPRFYEQFSEDFGARGNRQLKPEQSRSAEIGADVTSGNWTLGATVFSQTFRDLIQYTFMPVTADSVNYTNVGEVKSRGVELEARLAAGALALRANLTLLDTEVTDAGAGNDPLYQAGERLIRRPARTASITASYGTNFNVGATVSYVGEREDLYYDDNFTPQRVALPAYARIDLTGRTPGVSGLHGMLRIENALDEEYEEIRNFPARGRVFFIGVILQR